MISLFTIFFQDEMCRRVPTMICDIYVAWARFSVPWQDWIFTDMKNWAAMKNNCIFWRGARTTIVFPNTLEGMHLPAMINSDRMKTIKMNIKVDEHDILDDSIFVWWSSSKSHFSRERCRTDCRNIGRVSYAQKFVGKGEGHTTDLKSITKTRKEVEAHHVQGRQTRWCYNGFWCRGECYGSFHFLVYLGAEIACERSKVNNFTSMEQ